MIPPPPAWQRPEGVDASLWAYMQSVDVADLESREESTAPLAQFDRLVLNKWLANPGRAVDLGCGTGRNSLELARRGFEVVAIDLASMSLSRLTSRIEPGQSILPIRADLCRLDMLQPEAFDVALLMYSTLGMVRGRANRRKVLRGAARAVREGGQLVVHAHNFWATLHPSTIANRVRTARWPVSGWLDRLGDCPMLYAGIPDVTIHAYRFLELSEELRATGWRVADVMPLARGSGRRLTWPRLGHFLRANGWIIRACRAKS
jgi:SAM-dependent methyltransferase